MLNFSRQPPERELRESKYLTRRDFNIINGHTQSCRNLHRQNNNNNNQGFSEMPRILTEKLSFARSPSLLIKPLYYKQQYHEAPKNPHMTESLRSQSINLFNVSSTHYNIINNCEKDDPRCVKNMDLPILARRKQSITKRIEVIKHGDREQQNQFQKKVDQRLFNFSKQITDEVIKLQKTYGQNRYFRKFK